ncbi:denticleless protein A [Capsicum galapagoense]
MDGFKHQSFFQDIKSREVHGYRVKRRPYISHESCNFNQIGAVAVDHDGFTPPPMALAFCKTGKNSHIVAVTDEGGYLSLFNTRVPFPSSSTHLQNAEKAKVLEWVAHDNAIFDVCWIKEDTNILTASGDQSIKVWDAQGKQCVRALMGHTGSVKSICPHPTNHDIVVSGSRDGSFALWDLRCPDSCSENRCIPSIATVHEAHISPCQRRTRRGKASSVSITSILYLKDELSIASAGAVDSVIKFWDTRNLKCPVVQACPHPDVSAQKAPRYHGVSSLSQDLNGAFISASCMDSRIYLYNVLQAEKGPVKTFKGCKIESFFVKSAISPDASHILSGSSDGNAYVWQVNKPLEDPIMLKGHDGEVTALDWCTSETGKVATSSDDFTVRFWNIHNSCYSNIRSPSSIRRRVTALSSMQRRKLFSDEKPASIKKGSAGCDSNLACHQDLPDPITVPEMSTPVSKKRKPLLSFEPQENFEKTPEAAKRSPSSVLNPPSSLRKTIRDYFLVTPPSGLHSK